MKKMTSKRVIIKRKRTHSILFMTFFNLTLPILQGKLAFNVKKMKKELTIN